jgi:hypothetical protein
MNGPSLPDLCEEKDARPGWTIGGPTLQAAFADINIAKDRFLYSLLNQNIRRPKQVSHE